LAVGQGREFLQDRIGNLRKVRDLKGPLADCPLGSYREASQNPLYRTSPGAFGERFLRLAFDEAAVCAIDGFGDFVSTSLAYGKDSRLKILEKICFPHSLGMLYTAITQYLGFTGFGDEFKVMGLAPYGKPGFTEELRQLVRLTDNGLFELNLNYFRHWSEGVEMEWEEGYPTMGKVYSVELERLLGPARHPDEPLSQRHEDIANSLQAVYETARSMFLMACGTRTKSERLCLAGGCAMNSVANGKIRTRNPVQGNLCPTRGIRQRNRPGRRLFRLESESW
jgi:carbamoyltransferase